MEEKSSAILEAIHDAEKRAEGIVRAAEANAQAIRQKGRDKAAEILKNKKKELEERFESEWRRECERLEVKISEERDARLAELKKHEDKKNGMMDSLVEEMMATVLPLNRGGPDDR